MPLGKIQVSPCSKRKTIFRLPGTSLAPLTDRTNPTDVLRRCVCHRLWTREWQHATECRCGSGEGNIVDGPTNIRTRWSLFFDIATHARTHARSDGDREQWNQLAAATGFRHVSWVLLRANETHAFFVNIDLQLAGIHCKSRFRLTHIRHLFLPLDEATAS